MGEQHAHPCEHAKGAPAPPSCFQRLELAPSWRLSTTTTAANNTTVCRAAGRRSIPAGGGVYPRVDQCSTQQRPSAVRRKQERGLRSSRSSLGRELEIDAHQKAHTGEPRTASLPHAEEARAGRGNSCAAATHEAVGKKAKHCCASCKGRGLLKRPRPYQTRPPAHSYKLHAAQAGCHCTQFARAFQGFVF